MKENQHLLDNMAFNGTWQVFSQENYEEFLRAMGEKDTSGSVVELQLAKIAILMELKRSSGKPQEKCYFAVLDSYSLVAGVTKSMCALLTRTS